MKSRLVGLLGLFLLLPAMLLSQASTGPTVRFRTSLGDIDVLLLPNSAPKTVANFLNYVDRGAYNNTIFHRSVSRFIIQGGGFTIQNHVPVEIPADPPVQNEFSLSNTRGTIAMAKLGDNPNSATNQWFFNLSDNSSNLNNQNGGFTVFGRVANTASLAVMDKLGAAPVYNAGSPFDSLPLINYTGGDVQDSNFLSVNSITRLEVPSIASNGIVTASSFGGYRTATAGAFLEIYGANLAGSTRAWAESDFTNGNAPTSLDGVSVTVDNKPAYVSFISPSQVNVQVPANVPLDGSVAVVVTNKGQASAQATISLKPFAAGLLAPASFNVNGKQYVAALHANNAFVSNGSVPDVPAAPAVPGETLTFYGTGFGPVSGGDNPVAGRIITGTTTLNAPVQFQIGDSPATVQYAGFAPNFVGLYQFNVTVPATAPNGDVPVKVTLSGDALPQTLFLSVQAAQK